MRGGIRCRSAAGTGGPANRTQLRRLAPGCVLRFRVQEPMHVDDEVPHVGVVDGLLGLGLPGDVSRRVVWKDSNDVELVEVLELEVAETLEFAAEGEMEQLLVVHGKSFALVGRLV